jgi:hypothetical protein
MSANAGRILVVDDNRVRWTGASRRARFCDRWPPGQRPRIVAMTANAMQEDRDACFDSGMDD